VFKRLQQRLLKTWSVKPKAHVQVVRTSAIEDNHTCSWGKGCTANAIGTTPTEGPRSTPWQSAWSMLLFAESPSVSERCSSTPFLRWTKRYPWFDLFMSWAIFKWRVSQAIWRMIFWIIFLNGNCMMESEWEFLFTPYWVIWSGELVRMSKKQSLPN